VTRLFVTGTDTDVGKTHVTALLARAARAAGRSVVACKPVASGVPAGEVGGDAEALGRAAGHPPLTWATFAAPLSPHRAALLEGRGPPPDLLDRLRALAADVVLVEGAGGWRVPVSLEPPLWMEDLARATGGEVVVVAADRLGVLNHALLTVDAVRRSGFRVRALVLNAVAVTPDPSRDWNAEDLSRLTDVPIVRVGFFHGGPQEPEPGADLRRVILPPTEPA
jgi:dethiobiotin synthetase